MIKWKRGSGSIIELQDTPEMTALAKAKGWIKVVEKKPKLVEKSNGKSRRSNT